MVHECDRSLGSRKDIYHDAYGILRPMRHCPKQRGFTIIETLIFLTVSASVFAAAIGQYTLQQHQVDFRQGVRSLQSELQSMINEVGTTYAPSITNFHCMADDLNNPISFISSPGDNDNSGCVFLGRVLAMGSDASVCTNDTTSKCERYSDIPVAGRRLNFVAGNPGQPVSSFAEAKPLALARCTTNDVGSYNFACGSTSASPVRPNIANRQLFSKDKIGVYKAFVRNADGSAATPTGAIGFFINLSSASGNTANSVNLLTVPGVTFEGNTETKVVNALSALGTSAVAESTYVNPGNGVTLCIIGQYDQKGAITIGANNGQLDVVVEPQDNLDSGCN